MLFFTGCRLPQTWGSPGKWRLLEPGCFSVFSHQHASKVHVVAPGESRLVPGKGPGLEHLRGATVGQGGAEKAQRGQARWSAASLGCLPAWEKIPPLGTTNCACC